jgi:hypothetical protein
LQGLRAATAAVGTLSVPIIGVIAAAVIFKLGMKGVYQHCSEKHLHRYLSEFDFRYSNRIALGVNDGERRTLAIQNATGKRLTYRGRH